MVWSLSPSSSYCPLLSRALDKKTVKDKLSLYLEESQPFWLLLFPEGTLLDEETVGWSNAYIKKMDLQDEYAFEKVLLLF